ncbi:hypothetical protein ODS41_06615 [Pyrobaculum sp. 3827-6]|uniref:hypothetical protein n=1 Tax=Pyrobaculum sp. 3827-6 TaxID=2983604 RepID=UPI0021D8D77F|nr:hypothetical protein [Pyrobaculum sp. 3827-6]MCU7787587.1 hypothetical protein [Pyrobaculum sp. 3827-6]
MVDADIVISSLIAQAPLVALAVVVLYYTLEKRIEGVKYELGRRIEGVDRKI